METYMNIENSKIPLLGLGTWNLNGKECISTVEAAITIGYRHLDTAQLYGNEAEVGKGVQQSNVGREDIFITTKIATENLEPSALTDSAHNSLKKLNTAYIDLLLIHWPTSHMELKATLAAMFKLKDQGKVKHVGVSNFNPSLFRQAIAMGPVVCNQVEFSPYKKPFEILEVAKESDLMITAYSPLAQGKVPGDENLREIGMNYEKSAVQVALRWLLQLGNISVIPKASGVKHLEENMDIFGFELTQEHMDQISGK